MSRNDIFIVRNGKTKTKVILNMGLTIRKYRKCVNMYNINQVQIAKKS